MGRAGIAGAAAAALAALLAVVLLLVADRQLHTGDLGRLGGDGLCP